MATKNQTELALKALLTELNCSGCDLYDLIDRTVLRMHHSHLFIKEDSRRERGGAEDALFSVVESLAGKRPEIKPRAIETFDIEDF